YSTTPEKIQESERFDFGRSHRFCLEKVGSSRNWTDCHRRITYYNCDSKHRPSHQSVIDKFARQPLREVQSNCRNPFIARHGIEEFEDSCNKDYSRMKSWNNNGLRLPKSLISHPQIYDV